jgi:AraC-like DNA-binding protein
MSRSAFAARFSQLVGEPAVRYVTRWKMHAARMWLKEENAALTEIASRLGYEWKAAFRRAFKRLVGISPGAARRRGPRALHNAAVLPKR